MRKIIVVDSDKTNCHLLGEIAAACGWELAGCANSVEGGVAQLGRVAADCLITEFWFGSADNGLDLIARARDMVPGIFTIMFTGWMLEDVAQVAGTARIMPDRLIRKPSSPHELMAVLRDIPGADIRPAIRVAV